nr:MAG TPA: Protein of unknown function (DUF2830) [Caudoviricetes sp.]
MSFQPTNKRIKTLSSPHILWGLIFLCIFLKKFLNIS